MQTRTLLLAVCGLVAVGLAGCSSSSDQSAAPPPATAAAAPAPAPAPAPSPPPAPSMPNQQMQRVATLQTALNNNGAQLNVDGKMGPATRTALKQFQSSHHLKVTGRADPATVKALGG